MNNSRNFVVLLIVAFVAIIGISVMIFAPSIVSNFSDVVGYAAHPVYPSFSSPETRLTINNNILSVSDYAIYKTGYFSINGNAWVPFTLSGTVLSGNWLNGNAIGNLPTFGSGENYVVIYSCSKTNGVWDCHDGTVGKWQLQIINNTVNVSKISIYAAGIVGAGAYPTMELMINNVVVASWIVGGDANVPTYSIYNYTYAGTIDKNTIIRVNYPNDVSGTTRDLRVDKVLIDGVAYESESSNNINTGMWDGVNCGGIPYPGDEWLVCSGYIQYNLSSISSPIQPTCSDRIKNQGETGVDCGGPCAPCSTPLSNTFYIDPSGMDVSSRNGSINSPWKSLSYACSKVQIPNAVIHVNQGTYIETKQCNLAPSVSIEGVGSSSTGSIIKSHYDGGTSDWDDGFILLSGGTNSGQHVSGIYFDGDSEVGDNGIVVYDRSHVSIYDCTFINFYQEAVRFWGSSNNVDNSIHDCTIKDSSASVGMDYRTEAIGLGYQTGFLFYDNNVTNNGRPDGENGDGMRLWDEIYAPKIYNNHFIGPEVCNGANYYPFIIEFWNQKHVAGYGAEIYGNDFIGQVDFGSGGGKGDYDYAFYVHDNYFHATSIHPITEWTCGLQIEEHVNDIVISNNLFQNLETPIYLCSQDTGQSFNNIKIYNNVFKDIVWGYQAVAVPSPGDWSTHGTGIMIGGGHIPVSVSNIYIWNNVFTAYSGRPAETAIWLPTAQTCSNIFIQNNIFLGFATAPMVAQLRESGGTLDNVVIQKNLFNNNGNNNNFLQKYFTATHVTDDGGIIGNPSFVSPTDFHLQSNSPAIWKGTDVGLTTDREGNTYHNPPSIGAYEYH